jgi:hypothetical protein
MSGLRRSATTWKLYAAYGVLGYLLAGFGVILPELRQELHLSRAEVALYPSAFALGLVVVGFVGDRLLLWLGVSALRAALGAQVGGALLLCCAFGRVFCGAGALLLGVGAAALANFAPARLRAEHGAETAVAIGEGNAVASASSVAAPLFIAASLALGGSWRTAFVLPPLMIAAPLLWGGAMGAASEENASSPLPSRDFAFRWMDLVVVVAAEFCVLFFAADFLRNERAMTSGAATAYAALFVLGMATARAASSAIARAALAPPRLLAISSGMATAGFAVLWSIDSPVAAGAGLFVTGLGVGQLYPVTVAEALAAWPANPNRAAARAALASGCAIGAAPISLGLLADAMTLRAGVLLAPALLAGFTVRCLVRRPLAQGAMAILEPPGR